MWRLSTLDLAWVQVLALWKQRSRGTERTNPRRHRKYGECQQGRPHCDAAASREFARNAIATSIDLCKGTCPSPTCEGPGGVDASGEVCGRSTVRSGRPERPQRGRRQGGPTRAEPQAAHGGAHGEDLHGRGRAHGRRTVGKWRVARCWWLLVWLAVGFTRRWCADSAWWRDGSPWDGSGASQGCCVRAAARTVRPPGGFGSYDGRGNGFAAGSCVDDAHGAEHVLTEPRAVGDSVGACYAQSAPQEGGRTESGSSWCKVPDPRDQE